MLKTTTMKKISKYRLFYSVTSGAILGFVPAFLLVIFFAKSITTSTYSSFVQLAIYMTCFLGTTVWIYNSDSEFQFYYCDDCSHEWSKKRHVDDRCPKCKSEKWIYNYKPWYMVTMFARNAVVRKSPSRVNGRGFFRF